MSLTSFGRADLAERQRTFTGLLAHQLIAPWTHPALHALTSRHEHTIEVWCGRLGYRLIRIDQCYRLRRTPVAAAVAAPREAPPPRRALVLALLAAAVLEDQRQDSVTLQEISDALRHFASANDFAPYDPEQRSHRRSLFEGVDRLVTLGVLERRTRSDDLLQGWEQTGSGIGAGYLIHRDALVLLVDTRDVQLALEPVAAGDPRTDTRNQRLLRALVETQALHPLDLDDADRAYLITQGRRLQDQTEEMTGGTVERRSDAWVLVLPSDAALDPALTIGFPEPSAVDWVSLGMLDAAGHRATVRPDGRRRCPGTEVDGCAARLHAEHAGRLTLALRESPVAIRRAAEDRLREIGLLTVDDGSWVLEPESGRYRSADLQVSAVAPAPPDVLFGEPA